MREGPRHFYAKDYPSWFYPIGARLDFSNAIPTDDYARQNFSVVPRHCFIDAYCRCEKCKKEFSWTAQEQKHWFDDLHVYVGSYPRECPDCRKKQRKTKGIYQEYGAKIKKAIFRTTSLESKRKMIALIDQMENGLKKNELPDIIRKNREILEKQIARMQNCPCEMSGDDHYPERLGSR